MTDLVQDHDEHGWVTRMLADDDPGPMPDAVSRRIEVVLRRGMPTPATPAAWPAAGPPAREARPAAAAREREADPGETQRVATLSGPRRAGRAEAAEDRRRLLLYRVLPAAAAAVVVVGVGLVATTQLVGSDDAGPADTLEAGTADDAGQAPEALAEPDGPTAPPPNGLVATGTAYTADTLPDAVRALVATVSGGRSDEGELAEEAGDAAAAEPAAGLVDGSPLASAAAFGQCAEQLGAPEGQLPLAVDLATYEGTDAAIVVLPAPGEGYEVVITDRTCRPGSERGAFVVPTEPAGDQPSEEPTQ